MIISQQHARMLRGDLSAVEEEGITVRLYIRRWKPSDTVKTNRYHV